MMAGFSSRSGRSLCFRGGARGVELVGFHNRAALGRRERRGMLVLVARVPERLRNGEE
jgi:hypothetical protein